jgi:HlyD family secretion protein
MPDNYNIEIRNEEVQEIMGQVPSWIVRWGTSLVVGILLLFIAGSFVYKSPSVVHEPVIITTENPPAKVIARADGKIESLFVEDKQHVMPEKPLALIENPANYEDVMKLKFAVNSIDFEDNYDTPLRFSSLNLGEIQPYYETFKKAYDTYAHFHVLDYHPKKSTALKNELKKLNNLLDQLQKQNTIIYEDLLLLRKQFRRDSTLHAEGVISDQAIDQSKAKLLQKQLKYHESLSRMSEIELDIARLEEVQIDNENEFAELNKTYFLQLKESFENLNAQITIWENTYVLKSPIEGTVSFSEFWSTNQSVNQGSTIMVVIPENEGSVIGKISLGQDGAGKVKEGQKVIIKMKNYPYLEYGVLEGRVSSISMAAENDMFSVFVELPDELITNYGKVLDFSHDMEGNAEIITQSARLVEKLINPVKSILKRNSG